MDSHGKVTPRELGEEALRDLVDAAFDALVISHEGKIVFANRSFVEMYGGSIDEVLGRSIQHFVAPESLATVTARLTTPSESRYEAVGLRRDGTKIDVEICARDGTYEGRPVRISAIRYITERKQAEEALRQSEARLHQLIERMTDMIVVQRRGTIVFANTAALRYLGYANVGDIMGTRALELVDPGDRGRVLETWKDANPGMPPPLLTVRIVRKDALVGVVEIAAAPIDEFDGEPALLLLGRDVAERQNMESRLVQADLLSSIGMLSAGIAHEINNPLAYVTLNLAAMTRKLAALRETLTQTRAIAQLRELEELLAMSSEGADRVRHIVHDFRVFARGSAARSAVELPSVLDAAIKLASSSIRHRARLVREYRPVPLVDADEPRLSQLFLNVITNAFQAFDEKTSAEENEIQVRTSTAPDGAAIVEIVDNGPGIPADVLGRVFEPFFSTKAPGVGTGLGLPICRSIVGALGGTIAIESTVGRGTTCRVTFPALAGEVRAVHPAPPRAEAPAPRSRRVLVVDDEPALLRTLAEALGRHHDVRCTSSGTEAIELVLGGDFDVVVCDVMMPSTSGIDVYDAVRRRRPGLEERFVFMTAGTFTRAAREFLASVTNEKLEKPFTHEELQRAVDGVGRRIR